MARNRRKGGRVTPRNAAASSECRRRLAARRLADRPTQLSMRSSAPAVADPPPGRSGRRGDLWRADYWKCRRDARQGTVRGNARAAVRGGATARLPSAARRACPVAPARKRYLLRYHDHMEATAEIVAAKLVRLARQRANLSQRELARRSGVPQSVIARIESGARQPTLPTLDRILAGAGLEARYRLEERDDHDRVLRSVDAGRPAASRQVRQRAQDSFLCKVAKAGRVTRER